MQDFLNAEVVICYKHREKPNEIGKMLAIGDVNGRDIVLVDDMVDTAGTLSKAAESDAPCWIIVLELYVLMEFFLALHIKELKILLFLK